MDRTEAGGFGIAVVGHIALLAALTVGLSQINPPPPSPPSMEVSFVDEVALTSASPTPLAEPPAPSEAPALGAPEEAAPAPTPDPAPAPPTPAPAPAPPRPAPAPTPRRATPAPAPPRPAATPPRDARPRRRPEEPRAGQAQRSSGARLADLNLDGIGRDPSPSRAQAAPAAAMSARAAADIGSAITRQVQPCADRQVDPGPGANRIVTTLNLRLNRDGSLAARPRVVRQSNVDEDNSRYAQRVSDIAIAAFTGCSPLRGLPAELYDVPRGWSNFTMNYRLPG
jgi:outer membrane biosynthesis protein TonB